MQTRDGRKVWCWDCIYYSGEFCKRFPPTRTAESISGTTMASNSMWPRVKDDDWCGEFTRDPEDPNAKI